MLLSWADCLADRPTKLTDVHTRHQPLQKHAAKRLGEERAKVASQAEVQIGPKVERVRAIEVGTMVTSCSNGTRGLDALDHQVNPRLTRLAD